MPDILYAAFVKNGQILAEAKSSEARDGDLNSIATAIALQAKPNEKLTVTVSGLAGHYVVNSDGLVILAITGLDCPKRIPLWFLKNVEESLPFHDWSSLLKSKLEESQTRRDTLYLAQSEIDQVKNVMFDNIDRLLERGERASLLVDRTSEMNANAAGFRWQATQVQRKFWWQNIKFKVFVFLCVVVVICLIYLFFSR